MFEQKLQCDSGNINACNYCKDEYIKNLRTSKKRSKTPQVPVQALPKSKSKSKSRPRKTTRRRKGCEARKEEEEEEEVSNESFGGRVLPRGPVCLRCLRK